jgi:hypothetical protein
MIELISPEFAKAWVAALVEMPDLRADETVDTGKFSYKYADLRQVLELVRPILHRHKLGIHQPVVSEAGAYGVKTVVTHVNGEQMTVGELAIPTGANAQQVGSSVSYARRYSLLSALGLAVEDDDGAAASRPPQRQQDRVSRPQPPAQPDDSMTAEERETALAELVQQTPGAGTTKDIEARVRMLFRLMVETDRWKAGAFHAAMNAKRGELPEPIENKIEHWSDIGKKVNQQAFAEIAWDAAKVEIVKGVLNAAEEGEDDGTGY